MLQSLLLVVTRGPLDKRVQLCARLSVAFFNLVQSLHNLLVVGLNFSNSRFVGLPVGVYDSVVCCPELTFVLAKVQRIHDILVQLLYFFANVGTIFAWRVSACDFNFHLLCTYVSLSHYNYNSN